MTWSVDLHILQDKLLPIDLQEYVSILASQHRSEGKDAEEGLCSSLICNHSDSQNNCLQGDGEMRSLPSKVLNFTEPSLAPQHEQIQKHSTQVERVGL